MSFSANLRNSSRSDFNSYNVDMGEQLSMSGNRPTSV